MRSPGQAILIMKGDRHLVYRVIGDIRLLAYRFLCPIFRFTEKNQTNLSGCLNFGPMISTEISAVREQIIETASRLFYSQGYHLTGINQVIEEAGIAKASLYYHFPSKEDLCVAYLQRRYRIWSEKLQAALHGIAQPRRRLIRTFLCRSEYLVETGYGGCSYSRIIAEMPQRSEKINNQVILHKESQLQFFLQQVRQIPGMGAREARELAQTIALLFDGATVQCQVYRRLSPMDHAIRALRALLA